MKELTMIEMEMVAGANKVLIHLGPFGTVGWDVDW